MSKRAEEASLKAYPEKMGIFHEADIHYEADLNKAARIKYIEGYEQAEKETIERACKLLYDFNKQMTSMFGPKAFLSCNQYTIDVNRFRKILEMEHDG